MTSQVRDYPPIAVTVDVVVLTESEGEQGVVLIRRGNHPFQGAWALPGGFLEVDEELVDGAVRELAEETGLHLRVETLHQQGVYGRVGRDPRVRTVSVVYVTSVPEEVCRRLRGGDDAVDARVFRVSELGSPGGMALAFDHAEIVADALSWAQG